MSVVDWTRRRILQNVTDWRNLWRFLTVAKQHEAHSAHPKAQCWWRKWPSRIAADMDEDVAAYVDDDVAAYMNDDVDIWFINGLI
jgi:hypothetical protein